MKSKAAVLLLATAITVSFAQEREPREPPSRELNHDPVTKPPIPAPTLTAPLPICELPTGLTTEEWGEKFLDFIKAMHAESPTEHFWNEVKIQYDKDEAARKAVEEARKADAGKLPPTAEEPISNRDPRDPGGREMGGYAGRDPERNPDRMVASMRKTGACKPLLTFVSQFPDAPPRLIEALSKQVPNAPTPSPTVSRQDAQPRGTPPTQSTSQKPGMPSRTWSLVFLALGVIIIMAFVFRRK